MDDDQLADAILAARERAGLRGDWFILVPGAPLFGPYSEADVRPVVDALVLAGKQPRLLRVVEDYE